MKTLLAGILATVLLAALPARAEQSATFGDYTVHYVAFTTDILTAEVAKEYRIQRSKSRILLNVSVLKKVMGTTATPVRAQVTATATNLSAQLRELEIRELSSDGAIYYIAETGVTNEETLKFTVRVLPEGLTEPFTVSFEQQFFTR
jgi:hypothetical protein